MEEEESDRDQKWIEQLDILAGFTQQSIDFMDNYCSSVSKRSPSYRHPLTMHLNKWRLFYESFKKAVLRFKDNKSEVLLSTIINWVLPSLAITYNDLFIYIKTSVLEAKGRPQHAELNEEECKAIFDEFKLDTAFKIQDPTMQIIMKLPFIFMERFMERIIVFSQNLELRIGYLQSWIEQGSESINQKIMDQIQVLNIQRKELQNSLKQLNSTLELLNKEDEENKLVNRDNAVIQYKIITSQYSEILKTKRNITLAYRLKLICRWKKLEKKRIQRLKDRRMKILQLIDGEQRYISGLNEYITQVKNPIESLQLLTVDQKKLLFSSIGQIKELHQKMYEVLKNEYEKYTDTQCYGLVLKSFIPFFLVYTDYVLNATSAQKYLQELIKTSKEVNEICRRYTETTSKVAHNQLSQPTFRIARYEMLLESIIKSTSSSHPDKKYLSDCLKQFTNRLTQVNNEVDKIIRRNRLNQLDGEYGTIVPIYEKDREFLKQFPVLLIKQPKPEAVNLIVCSDLLLITDEQTKKLIKVIHVNQQFFARREENNKIYRNMVTVHSDGFMTFTTGSEDIKVNIAEEIYQVLKKITKDSGQQVYIKVEGTEQIGSTSFAKYTEYIIEVKYLDLKKLLHMRFSSVSEMVCIMKGYYKDDLKITEEENLKKSWFNSHKSKVIEARKIIIAQIFMKLFNHPKIKSDPEYFLTYLNLPPNFYDIARTSYQKRLSMGQSVTVSGLKRSYLTKREEKEAFTIICGTEIELGRDLFHDIENTEEDRKLRENAEKIQIQIFTLVDSEPIKITITDFDTVEDVCNKVSTLIGLRSNRDFRLFHQIGKKELRVLDHEQYLTKIFDFPKPQKDIIVGFVETIKSTFQKIVSPQTLPTLIFKKYYYLPYQIEQTEFRKDLTRLRLMVYQVFSEICDMKYQLTFDEYLLFLALLIYIKLDGQIQKKDEIDPFIVNRVIPSTVFKLKNYSEEEWLAKCSHHVRRIRQQIDKVIEFNRGQLKQNKIKADTVSKMALYFGHKHLCSQIVLNKIKSNPIFGSNIFYVQPHSSCYKKLEEKNLKVAYNMWLAVKVASLDLLTPSSKESILNIAYSEITDVEVFSQSIVIKEGVYETSYRFNTYQSFQISQLIKYNKALNSTISNLKENSNLNTRVKQYREQLMKYRTSSCEEEDSIFS